MTWKHARQNTIAAFMLIGPPIAGAAFMFLETLSWSSLVVVWFPAALMGLFLIGFIPAFLTGMIYAVLLRYRVIQIGSPLARIVAGSLIGGALAPLSGAVLAGAADDWSDLTMSRVAQFMIAGAVSGGICASFLPRPRWREYF